MWRFVKFLNRWLYCWFDSGTLTVRESGEYRIPTGFTPSQVWAEFDEPQGAGVCQAQPDGFDTKVIPGGFLVIVNLNSDRRKLRWVAIK